MEDLYKRDSVYRARDSLPMDSPWRAHVLSLIQGYELRIRVYESLASAQQKPDLLDRIHTAAQKVIEAVDRVQPLEGLEQEVALIGSQE